MRTGRLGQVSAAAGGLASAQATPGARREAARSRRRAIMNEIPCVLSGESRTVVAGPEPRVAPRGAGVPDDTAVNRAVIPRQWSETFGSISAVIAPNAACNTTPVFRGTGHVGSIRTSLQDEPGVRRMERVDPWGDFLRRLLLSASLAGSALPAAAEEPEQP